MISEADKSRFQRDGYLLVPGLVPADLCEAVVACVASWLGIDGERAESWPAPRGHGIVPIHHAAPLWALREFEPIHRVFADLYGREALWVSYDRASFKAPEELSQTDTSRLAEALHWDGDPSSDTLSIQGLVYLRDTDHDQGAFCCVPEVYRTLDTWLPDTPVDALAKLKSRVGDQDLAVVGGPQGSLVLWHRRAPHSSTRNRSDAPRWVQYVAMDRTGDEDARRKRIAQFEERRPPGWAVAQNVRGQQIPEPGPTYALSPHGRRLVGYDDFE